MSPGSRSGVNWMRCQLPPTLRARQCASEVLPSPGTSSSSRWPSASSATTASRTTSGLPWMTCSTLSAMRRYTVPGSVDGCTRFLGVGGDLDRVAGLGPGGARGPGRDRVGRARVEAGDGEGVEVVRRARLVARLQVGVAPVAVEQHLDL